MDFLSCKPSVFLIENQYEILVNTFKNGIISVKVGEEVYYEENSGVLSSEKNYAKIRIPAKVLDKEKKYTVIFRAVIARKAYFSEFSQSESAEFLFKPLLKEDNINIYHLADVHYLFELAKNTAEYFGDDLDLLVLNGDIGEVETVEDYFNVCKFVGDISKGSIPVIFVRGNHDTRGRLAERFTDFFPSNQKNTYFTFQTGKLCGVTLDCGEDKLDANEEYNSVNAFETYRKKELEFLRSIELPKDKICFAVSHICPVQTTETSGDKFDIERDVYTQWNNELERVGIKFMLSGHIHRVYLLPKNSEKSLIPHEYPVIVGSSLQKNHSDIWGTALNVCGEKLTVKFTDSNKNVREAYEIELKTGDIIKKI